MNVTTSQDMKTKNFMRTSTTSLRKDAEMFSIQPILQFQCWNDQT